MRKFALYFIIRVLLLAFSGCNDLEDSKNPPLDIFEHEPEQKTYGRDAREHWVIGENEERLEISAHELDEQKICTVCKSKIDKFPDGSCDVYDYDEHGNIIRGTMYDIDGSVINETFIEYTYDEHGNIILEKGWANPDYYIDGFPMITGWITENEYALDFEGNFYLIRKTETHDAGDYYYEEYIEDGLLSAKFYYDEDGKLYLEEHNEYLPDENGELYVSKSSLYDFNLGNKNFYEYRPDGQILSLEEYNDAGECYRKEVYEYDGEDLICYAVFSYGELTGEYYLKTAVDSGGYEYNYIAEEYVFNEDGTGIHYEYDETGEILREENFG